MNAAAETAAAAPATPRRFWPWVLGGVLVFVLLAALAGAAALLALIDGARNGGFDVMIDGARWEHWWGHWGDWGWHWDGDNWPLALLGLAAALVVVLTVVPLAVLLGLLAALFGVGLALLAVVVAAAVALSPLWLLALLLWLVLRKPRASMPR